MRLGRFSIEALLANDRHSATRCPSPYCRLRIWRDCSRNELHSVRLPHPYLGKLDREMSEDLAAFDLVLAASDTLQCVEIHSALEVSTSDDLLAPRDFTALRLEFTGTSIWILCLGASDEVSVSLTRPTWPSIKVSSLTSTQPWADCVGLPLRDVSLLTNARGYNDALQLQFGRPDPASHSRVQVEAIASRFWFWRVTGPFRPHIA